MRILLFGLLLAVTACRRPSSQIKSTLTPVSSSSEPADYSRYLKAGDEVVALGSKPIWSLTINPSKNTMRFKTPDGDSINTPVPDRITDSNGGFRYTADLASGRLLAIFRPDSCVDALSGQRFDYRVDVTAQGKHYVGCGVSLRQMTLLQDIWVLTELNGKPVSADSEGRERPRLEFMLTEGRVTGTTSCNRLSGSVRADSRQLQFGPLITTKMACLNDSGNLENEFLQGLQTQSLSYQVGERQLTLLRNNVSLMTFKKVD
ncbi:META domain-containing protein [Spirosoma utsteinense]|uniref:Heat shock protein HslJ n=1 Tax=Spirosoma utsteinense TaxID=2585773 RepID=A0ABR6W9Z0_9BACT|nr:META domain-containing protein [Spirosoma utsteinense]MBC3784135.1 heat shock protein HslJ [Spirosoma utsteinense]MBC3792776.1 heat shock protein HslJ [Spirosoma utsteinense]